ncbi:uncharacterized protein LOC143361385 [Halictus rubicundus]|uniref:uncharacterized protein LOC143361385 n=1 Tax=Halictus rubicundus TaxID=77578 RepID=UPI0040360A87
MYANKENKMKYFLGGSAVGIAAGFLIGKIIKNTSEVQAQTSRTGATNNEKIKKYSQDDNIHNLSHLDNVHSGRVRSTSSSQYENVVWKDESKVSNTKMDNYLANNINDLSLKEKPNKLGQKDFYSNVTRFYDTSIEDNTEIENVSKVINIERTANTNKKKLLKRSDCCTSAELSDILNTSLNGDLQSLVTDERVSENNIDNNEKENKCLNNLF